MYIGLHEFDYISNQCVTARSNVKLPLERFNLNDLTERHISHINLMVNNCM